MSNAASVPELKSASELAADIQGKNTKPELEIADDPKDQKEYTFEFSFQNRRGKRWKGTFINRILSIRQKQQVKVLKAQLSGCLPVQSLDADIWALNEIIAHMTISLIKRPDWADELTDLYDEELLEALYKEVASHEAFFHRRETSITAGSELNKD